MTPLAAALIIAVLVAIAAYLASGGYEFVSRLFIAGIAFILVFILVFWLIPRLFPSWFNLVPAPTAVLIDDDVIDNTGTPVTQEDVVVAPKVLKYNDTIICADGNPMPPEGCLRKLYAGNNGGKYLAPVTESQKAIVAGEAKVVAVVPVTPESQAQPAAPAAAAPAAPAAPASAGSGGCTVIQDFDLPGHTSLTLTGPASVQVWTDRERWATLPGPQNGEASVTYTFPNQKYGHTWLYDPSCSKEQVDAEIAGKPNFTTDYTTLVWKNPATGQSIQVFKKVQTGNS